MRRNNDNSTLSFGTSLADGTLDVAALAGLFATGSVETMALAVWGGFGAVAVSGLSLLGILGLVRSAFKLIMGVEKLQKAGFDATAVRALLGYQEGEAAKVGILVPAAEVAVKFEANGISVTKNDGILDTHTCPMLKVGQDQPIPGWGQTLYNEGSRKRQLSFATSFTAATAATLICTGANCWLILIISTAWTWFGVTATVGLHSSLSLLLLLPLWMNYQLYRPGQHFGFDAWKALWWHTRPLFKDGNQWPGATEKMLHFLQVSHVGQYVIHFQGRTSWFRRWPFRTVVAVLVPIVVFGYLCQYVVLKQGDDDHVLAWLACQTVLAGLRIVYWTLDPKVDDPHSERGGLIVVEDTANHYPGCANRISLPEILCAWRSNDEMGKVPSSSSYMPLWVLNYLLDNDLLEVLDGAARRNNRNHKNLNGEAFENSKTKIEHFTIHSVSLQILLAHRYPHIKFDGFLDSSWRLCLWRWGEFDIQPVILGVASLANSTPGQECWVEAVDVSRRTEEVAGGPAGPSLGSSVDQRPLQPCNLYAELNGQRVRLIFSNITRGERCNNPTGICVCASHGAYRKLLKVQGNYHEWDRWPVRGRRFPALSTPGDLCVFIAKYVEDVRRHLRDPLYKSPAGTAVHFMKRSFKDLRPEASRGTRRAQTIRTTRWGRPGDKRDGVRQIAVSLERHNEILPDKSNEIFEVDVMSAVDLSSARSVPSVMDVEVPPESWVISIPPSSFSLGSPGRRKRSETQNSVLTADIPARLLDGDADLVMSPIQDNGPVEFSRTL